MLNYAIYFQFMICEDLNVHRSINLQYLAKLTMTTRADTVIHFKL